MTELYSKQQTALRIIERSLDNFKKFGRNNYTPAKIRSRISSLKETWAQCIQGHAALMQTVPEANRESFDYFKYHHFDRAYDVYQAALDHMMECLEELEPVVSPNSRSSTALQPNDSASSFSAAHLPPINIPQFSGKLEEWESFRDRFNALIINNRDVSAVARMHFLSTSLSGRAFETIKNIPITADNFEIAWKTLTSRYENKRRLVEGHVSALYNLPQVTRESAVELNNLRDNANQAIASLRNLNRSADEILSDILVFSVSQKLDVATRKAWKLKSANDNNIPSYDDLDKFLSARARGLEELTPLNSSRSMRSKKPLHVTTASVASVSCPLCKAGHFINKCHQFIKKSPTQRLAIIKQANRCVNCFSSRHPTEECPSKYSCRTCSQRHHSMLHIESGSSATITANASHAASPSNEPSIATALCASKTVSSGSVTMLATARVTVEGESGRKIKVRALLDQGSVMTLISEKLAQTLRLRRIRMPVNISAVGGVDAGTYQYAARIQISPSDNSNPVVETTASILKTLTRYTLSDVYVFNSWSHIADLTLADSDVTSADPIDVIIGADLYNEIMLDGLRKGSRGQPLAQNTIFGWVLCGRTSNQVNPSRELVVQHCAYSLALDQELRRFWEIEEVPHETPLHPEEQKCEDYFLATHSRTQDGRYIVRLPFKSGPPIDIGDTRRTAEFLIRGLHRRLRSQPDLRAEYVQFLKEYEELGHMRKASVTNANTHRCVYIPHHPVIRDSSVTTRLRVVFNASCRSTNVTSLNDHLLSGAKLQTDLAAVIMRWRQFKYVYCADIAKMYRQILVDTRDIDYQRILWSNNESEPIQEYQLLTVTYGTASAPFLALRVLRQLIQDEGSAFPLAVSVLQENIYVDDVLFGADDIPLLSQIREQVCSLLRRGQFELRKWSSNSAPLLKDIEVANHGLACDKLLQSDEHLKILGISWNPSGDIFQFKTSLPDNLPKTKRSILSTISKLFDPLGWGTPVIVRAKILLQRLWQLKLDWDEPIPSHLFTYWESIYLSLSQIRDLKIDRWTNLGSDTVRCELHGFADASTEAYAASVYIRVISFSGEITTSLLIGKSRVAPLKTLSVPRLELSAAVLLTRLLTFVISSLRLSNSPCYCWTDSTTALAWINQHPAKWKTFVSNRVSEIQSSLPNAIWQHVPSQDNPADCASRGLLGEHLVAHVLWWQGPNWLRLDQSEWPVQTTLTETSIDSNPRAIVHVGTSTEYWALATRYSSWPKLLRVTAYIIRFVNRLRRINVSILIGNNSLALSTSEINHAKEYWIKQIQSEAFPLEREALLNRRPLASKGALISLNPFLDDSGIIRVGGRLKNAPLPLNTKHPIVLASHPIVRLIVHHAHLRSLHAGTQLTLAVVRQDFWILRARNLVKSIINQCVVCTREKAATLTERMGNLPLVRVSPPSRAFIHCGVDYAGPVHVRPISGRGIASHKAYIAIFVCLASRAVHLELVDGYSTSAFLAALARFSARRGFPSSIYCDNGTTFVGAEREIGIAFKAALRDPDVQNRIACDSISWYFIPPSAPHFGGLWEAGVRSTKHHLRRVLGAHMLTFEEFTTLLCNIEACLNSRPLAPLTDNLENYEPLTPGHFLIGTSLTTRPEPSLLEINENRLSRWQIVRQLSERFWKLWMTDYVNTLQQRVKWKKKSTRSIKPGLLVLLHNPLLPPCKWELARVIHCHPGSDGLVRVVTVRTATSEYKRPITKLCLLPVDLESTDSPP